MTSEISIQAGREQLDKGLLRLLPGLLLLVLASLPFLTEAVARDLVVQVTVVVLLVLAIVDYATLKVPNVIVYSAMAFLLAATAVLDAALLPETLLGGLACLGIMFALAIAGRGAMGMGDVKLSAIGGLLLGLKGGILALLLGFVIGAAVALLLLTLHLRSRKDSVPLTPFLAAGSIVYALAVGTVL